MITTLGPPPEAGAASGAAATRPAFARNATPTMAMIRRRRVVNTSIKMLAVRPTFPRPSGGDNTNKSFALRLAKVHSGSTAAHPALEIQDANLYVNGKVC